MPCYQGLAATHKRRCIFKIARVQRMQDEMVTRDLGRKKNAHPSMNAPEARPRPRTELPGASGVISKNSIHRVILVWFLWSTALTGVMVDFAGLNLNPERILFLIFFLPMVLSIIQTLGSTRRVLYSRAIWLYMAFLAVLALAWLQSGSVTEQIKGLVIYFIPTLLCFYFALRPDVDELVDLHGIRILTYLSIGGVFAFVLSPYFEADISSKFVGNTSNAISVKLTLIEPNIFGSTLAFFTILNLHKLRRNLATRLLFFAACIAILLSFSRGPYVAFAVGLISYFFLGDGRDRVSMLVGFWVLILSILLFLTVFPEFIQGVYENYIDRSDTIRTRTTVNSLALDRFWESPLFGKGPLSFSSSMSYVAAMVGATDLRQISISQMFVGLLHDSGIFGFSCYFFFLIGLLRYGLRKISNVNRNRRSSQVSAFLVLVIASQATTIHYTAVFGIAAGILGNGFPRISIYRATTQSATWKLITEQDPDRT